MTERFSINDLRVSPDERAETVVEVTADAVDELLRVHATTGIDLTCWEPVLQLVTLVYPYIVIEGTGPTDTNTVTTEHGETGRYWLDGDTSKPCNADAWVVSPDYQKYMQHTQLGYTR